MKYVIFVVGALAGVAFLIWSAGIGFSEENMIVEKIGWQENCNVIDVQASFVGISEKQLSGKGQEIQCKIVLNGVDKFEHENAYYCDMKDGLKTTIQADTTLNHDVELCCGLSFEDMTCKSVEVKSCGIEI